MQALLVIDLQAGAFDGQACEPLHDGARVLQNTAALLDAARAAGMPVVFIQHCEPEGVFVPGTDRWEVQADIAPLPGEPRVSKRSPSAFEATDLDATLRQAGVKQLVLCGLQSECCVTHTAREALALGYEVTLADDAHGTWPGEGLGAAELVARQNRVLAAEGVRLSDTPSLLSHWRR